MTEPEAERRGRGRPSAYSDELAEAICEALSSGSRWQDIEARFGVSTRSVGRWEASRPDFARNLAEARAAGARWWSTRDVLAEEPDAQRARVALEQSRWIAAKLAPTEFGDKLSIEVEHKIDLSGALASARTRVAVGVTIDGTGAAPSPARLGGSAVSNSWPELADTPSEQVPDFLK